ncbi:putative protein N(5)-glutamine methyltransferase [Cellulomonas sp. P22]|uniref:putative protein N(5)-glutamine methyltransferase n=1 Tax=Cellulomonas sp. P22 TaxID=3373189 RepID=UPI0037925827
MTAPLLPRPDLVDTLRAAGCVFAEDEALLLVESASGPDDLARMVALRVAGLPLEQVLGWAQFCGLRIAVEPGVFVPRRRTELLVHEAAAHVAATRARSAGASGMPRTVVVDLCCGSGAVAAALAAQLGAVEVHAVDIEPAAVRCARRNLAPDVGHVYEGDLDTPLPATLRGRVDVLVANAPYVPTDALDLLPPEARLHEPLSALDGGTDGLDVVHRVIEAAPGWLAPGGALLVETSERQGARVIEAMTRGGLAARLVSDDDLGATVAIGLAPERVHDPSD